MVGSLWLVKREVFTEIGGWRPHREILLPPSQDLLVRGWRAGRKIRMLPYVTAIILPTSAESRKGCYIRRDSHEQEYYARRIGLDPDALRGELLLKHGLACEQYTMLGLFDIPGAFRRLAGAAVKRFIRFFGVNPISFRYLIHYRRKGGFVDAVRRHRGLPEQ